MSRPLKKHKKVSTNLTFSPAFKAAAEAFCYDTGESLSALTERLIAAEMAARTEPDKLSALEKLSRFTNDEKHKLAAGVSLLGPKKRRGDGV
jgi:hypothetical protein